MGLRLSSADCGDRKRWTDDKKQSQMQTEALHHTENELREPCMWNASAYVHMACTGVGCAYVCRNGAQNPAEGAENFIVETAFVHDD